MDKAFEKFMSSTGIVLKIQGIGEELAFYIFEIAYLEGKNQK